VLDDFHETSYLDGALEGMIKINSLATEHWRVSVALTYC